MVIPWDGYSLSEFINFCQPLPSAKYVSVCSPTRTTASRCRSCRKTSRGRIVKALRMDEAMHPLTLLTFGQYGQTLPNQSGAPVRIILPWKYGYKSAKSIVKIEFTSYQPPTMWNELNPGAYGFYSNVSNNENIPSGHAKERRLDGSLFGKTMDTQMFNGYTDQVAGFTAG